MKFAQLLPNPDEPDPIGYEFQDALLDVEENHGLGPNPDEPDPIGYEFQDVLLDVEENHGLGFKIDVSHRPPILDSGRAACPEVQP